MKGSAHRAPATESPAKTPAETPGEEPVEITFWHSYSEGEEKIFTETVLTAFAEKYPNIKVNAIRMPYEGMDEQLVTAVSGDVAPDVMAHGISPGYRRWRSSALLSV